MYMTRRPSHWSTIGRVERQFVYVTLGVNALHLVFCQHFCCIVFACTYVHMYICMCMSTSEFHVDNANYEPINWIIGIFLNFQKSTKRLVSTLKVWTNRELHCCIVHIVIIAKCQLTMNFLQASKMSFN